VQRTAPVLIHPEVRAKRASKDKGMVPKAEFSRKARVKSEPFNRFQRIPPPWRSVFSHSS
jgi:hypothetical protein